MNPISLSAIDFQFLPEWAREPSAKQSTAITGQERPPRQGKRVRNDQVGSSKRSSVRRPEKDRKASGSGQGRFIRTQDVQAIPLGVKISFLPEPRALESVAEQIRSSIRAYPLFGLARMFLDKPERHHVRLQLPVGLHQCTICNSVSLDGTAVIAHVLKRHRNLFYQEERQPTETPKGNFASVARCTLNGTILGPTNHHAYQANLMRLYKTQFAHIPFERFKQSVVSVRDPEIIKKWQEEAAWKTMYKCLQMSESGTLNSEIEVERHFRENHAARTVRAGQEFIVEGEVCHQLEHLQLATAIRLARENEARFPVNLAGRLRENFFKMGLRVFKGKKGMQFVSLVRPRPLVVDANNVSEGIWAILQWIKANPGCERKTVLKNVSSGTDSVGGSDGTPPAPEAGNSPQDLHWLIRQGHVIEYYDGTLEVVFQPPAKSKLPQSSRPKALS